MKNEESSVCDSVVETAQICSSEQISSQSNDLCAMFSEQEKAKRIVLGHFWKLKCKDVFFGQPRILVVLEVFWKIFG